MVHRRVTLFVCTVLPIVAVACATKGFVRKQMEATQAEMARQSEGQETKLHESAERAAASGQLIDAADQRIHSLDSRVGELDTAASEALSRASEAQSRADEAAGVARDAEARLSQRIADRNRYRLVATRVIYFESRRADIRDAGVSELAEVAKALQVDPNAVAELQGFADQRGTDRFNDELARERVEAIIRHLVRRHGIDLRRIYAVAMGKEVALAAGEKPSAEVLANARRVDIRLLAPWSSWEDIQAGTDTSWPSASVVQGDLIEPSKDSMAPVTNDRDDAGATSQKIRHVAPPLRHILEDQRKMLLEDGNQR